MQFADFARLHGLRLPGEPVLGRWMRVPTDDHPRKRNGAYKYLGDIGWVQNHATMLEVEQWRPEREEVARLDLAALRAAAEREAARSRDRQDRAARLAAQMVKACRQSEHNYLHYKGLADHRGLVLGDDLIVPMRHWRSNIIVGLQVIRWVPSEMRYEKKMLPGTRAKGAVLRLGSPQAPRSWLVEGYATGLSVAAALRLMRSMDAVVICFSAGNLTHVAQQMGGRLVGFADHDQSGAGQGACSAAGIPFIMSPMLGEDANDFHVRKGVFALAQLLRSAPMPTG